jgi:hypothetical protein
MSHHTITWVHATGETEILLDEQEVETFLRSTHWAPPKEDFVKALDERDLFVKIDSEHYQTTGDRVIVWSETGDLEE